MKKNKIFKITTLVAFIILLTTVFIYITYINYKPENQTKPEIYTLETLPEYSGHSKVYINDDKPNFLESDMTTISFEKYSDLDNLKRCGVAYANIDNKLMPTEERGPIGKIKPSGWHSIKYDIVPGKYLYNRCHLIAFQLTGEKANEKNLITCTKNMNSIVMREYENMVAKYIEETNNHVLYRVTPLFKNNNLLASGVQMEGYSVEDKGKGISFNVYVYNVQQGIILDYNNGDSKLSR
ncbi:MAG: DNA/RNA non-specific endonuclease [Bacilli bacterium]